MNGNGSHVVGRGAFGHPEGYLVVRDPSEVREVFRRVGDFAPANALTVRGAPRGADAEAARRGGLRAAAGARVGRRLSAPVSACSGGTVLHFLSGWQPLHRAAAEADPRALRRGAGRAGRRWHRPRRDRDPPRPRRRSWPSCWDWTSSSPTSCGGGAETRSSCSVGLARRRPAAGAGRERGAALLLAARTGAEPARRRGLAAGSAHRGRDVGAGRVLARVLSW